MKNIRLNAEAYRAGHCFSVTIRTSHSKRLFVGAEAAKAAIRCLRHAAGRRQARVYAYCFMPDHVHILARTPEGVDFLSFVNYFKQISAVTLRLLVNNGGAAWQPRFYDHALRSDEGVWAAVSYIFANPVRAGLAEAPGQYPFSGSLEWPDILTAGLDSPVLHSEVILER